MCMKKEHYHESERKRAVIKAILLKIDPTLTLVAADFIVTDILESVNWDDPRIAGRELNWIVEKFYAYHYRHAGWC